MNVNRWIVFISAVGILGFGAIWLYVPTLTGTPIFPALFKGATPALDGNAFPVASPRALNEPNAIGWGVNSQAPEIQLKDLQDGNVRLSDFRGKPVLVNFWATWCVPCRTEMPLIERKYRQYQETQGFVVLGVDVKDDLGVDAVRQFLTGLSLTFPVVLDVDASAETAYNVLGLPSSFFIDRRGVIRNVRIGAMNEEYIETQLQNLFKDK